MATTATPSQEPRFDPKTTLFLIDISSFIFRAFYAIRPLTAPNGEPVNAVYGVATMLTRVIEEAGAEFVGVVYDSKEPSFRKEIYAEYKANRAETPDDLIPQFARIEELIRAMRIHSYRQSGIEADDLIATLARDWARRSPDNRVVVVSGDKDLMALVDAQTRMWDTLNNKVYEAAQVEEKFNVTPSQIRDYLALVGDSSDNIPGVPSIGPKTASDLLKAHGDLESVLKAAADGKIPGKRGEVLKTHAADARLSADLATLRDQLDAKAEAADLKYSHQVSEDLFALLRSLNFKTLAEKWARERGHMSPAVDEDGHLTAPHSADMLEGGGDEYVPPMGSAQGSLVFETSAAPTGDFRTIATEKDLNELLEKMDRTGEFGFDIETTSLNPRLAEVVGYAVAWDRTFGTYIPVGHRVGDQLPHGLVVEKLKPFIENPKYRKIGQNLKYDWSVLMSQAWKPHGIYADTMVAGYVLDPEGRHNLSTLAATHLDYRVTTYEEVCGKGKDAIAFDQVPIDQATRYSGEDAWISLKLWDALEPKLKAQGLESIFREIDLPLVEVLARMECEGVSVDEAWLAQLSREFEADLKRIQEKVETFTQGPINLNSPKQLAVLLFDQLKLPPQGKTKTGFSTDASVLDALSGMHEVPKLLLEFREVAKLKGTYVDTLPSMKDPKTGRIHAGFHQTVAATGRLSSSDPNLQNIPIRSERGRKIRRAFIPRAGNVLLSADYSQIELRLLAHMSGDKELTASFKKGEDVHTRTASEIFGLPVESVGDRERGIAKAINFGLMYGKTPFGLAQELKIPQKEARSIIDRYFERYSGVKQYLDQQILLAKEKGYALTLSGRKRPLPDINARNPAIRSNAERMAMNTPIQGTAADMIKIAMTRLDAEITKRGLRSRMISQVHDELLLDCPKDEAEVAGKLVEEVMENAMPLDVPLKVNSATGSNWMDL